jgi:hypothetical protein
MVRTIQTATPRPELREFVRVYAQREIKCDGAGFAQANTAVLEQVLAFELDARMVLGFPDGRSELCPGINAWGSLTYPFGGASFSGHILGFAIFLKASRFMATLQDSSGCNCKHSLRRCRSPRTRDTRPVVDVGRERNVL